MESRDSKPTSSFETQWCSCALCNPKQHHFSGIYKNKVVCQSSMAKWAKPWWKARQIPCWSLLVTVKENLLCWVNHHQQVPLVFPKNEFMYVWQSTRKQTVIFPCHMGVSTTCIWPAWHLFSAWEYIAIIAAVYLIFFQDYLQSNRIRSPVSLKHQLQPLFPETDGLLEFISRTNPASNLDRSTARHVSDLHTTCTKAKNGFLIYSEGKFMKCSISY